MTRAAVPALCVRDNRERGQVELPGSSRPVRGAPMSDDYDGADPAAGLCDWCGEAAPTWDCPECCDCDACYEGVAEALIEQGWSDEAILRALPIMFPSRAFDTEGTAREPEFLYDDVTTVGWS